MVHYKPGEEPEAIARRLTTFFARLDSYYPDKVVIGLHTEHKKLGERLTVLYRELGYDSGEEMLSAYGYTYAHRNRVAASDEERQNRKRRVIEELLRRYPDGSGLKSTTALMQENPDIANEIINSKLRKSDLIEAGLLIPPAANTSGELEPICDALRKMIYEKYPDGPQWTRRKELVERIPAAEPLLMVAARIIHRMNLPFREEMVKRGIFAANDVPAPKPKTPAITPPQLFRMLLRGDGTRAGSEMTRASFGVTFSEYLEKWQNAAPEGQYPDAFRRISDTFSEMEKRCDPNNVLPEDVVEQAGRTLAHEVELFGYADVRAFLTAFGYSLADKKEASESSITPPPVSAPVITPTPVAAPSITPTPASAPPIAPMVELCRGQRVAIPGARRLRMEIGWELSDSRCDVDVSAFMLAEDGKVPGDDWFVFYGQPESPDRSVTLSADGAGRCMHVDFGQMGTQISRITLVMTIHEALERQLDFSMVQCPNLCIKDADTGQALFRYRVDDLYGNVVSLTLGELYRHNGQWKFNPVGNGVAQDLAGLCAVYGVQIC